MRRETLISLAATCSLLVAFGGQTASSTPTAPASVATVDLTTPSPSPPPEPAVQGTSEPAEEAPAGAVMIVVNNSGVAFHPEEVTVPADAAVFLLVYEGEFEAGALRHNMNIGLELPPGAALVTSPTLAPGESLAFTVTGLEPGTYQYWCTINEHYSFGMVGTLTVTP